MGGAEGFRQAAEEAKALNRVVDEEWAEAAASFNDNMNRMSKLVEGLSFLIGETLIPKFNKLIRLTLLFFNIPIPEKLDLELRVHSLRIEIERLQKVLENTPLTAKAGNILAQKQLGAAQSELEDTLDRLEGFERPDFTGGGLSARGKPAAGIETPRAKAIGGISDEMDDAIFVTEKSQIEIGRIIARELKERFEQRKRLAESIAAQEKNVTRDLMTESQRRLADIKDSQQERLELIKQGLEEGIIDEREAAERRVKITEAALEKMKTQGESVAADLQGAFGRFTNSLFRDFDNVGNAWRTLMSNVLRIFLDSLLGMANASVQVNASKGGSIGGVILNAVGTSIFSSILGGIFDLFHEGGPVKKLPSFQTGGEVPILAQSGEFMIRRSAADRLGARTLSEINRTGALPEGNVSVPVTVNVFNNAQAKVTTRERSSFGKKEISILIEDIVGASVRNGGTVFGAIGDTFNVGRAGAAR